MSPFYYKDKGLPGGDSDLNTYCMPNEIPEIKLTIEEAQTMKEIIVPKKKPVKKQAKSEDQKDFRIEQLFGSKTRVKLLSLFLEIPDRSYYVRELTRKIDAQLNAVRRELQNLIDIGIIREVEGTMFKNEVELEGVKKKKDNKKYYQSNQDFVFFDELRSIMKKASALLNRSLIQDLCNKADVDLLFLTGRFVDDEDIPSDVMIVGNVPEKILGELIGKFEEQMGSEVNYTFMPKDEFHYRLEVKDRFLSSVLETEKIILINNTELTL
jgi:hypothetical protein